MVCRQAKIPKPPIDYNGSKPVNAEIPRDFEHFKKASQINKKLGK